MFSIWLAALVQPSLAQDRVVARVDPGYLEYLEELEGLGKADVLGTSDPQPQLWPGMVGIIDSHGDPAGTIFVGGSFPTMQEVWFFPAELDPSAPFGMIHDGWYPPGTEGLELAAEDPQWDLHPCNNMNVKYTQVPNATLTANLDYTPGITRTAFELWQGGEVVGRLLREHHQIVNMPEKFVDHWAMYTTYDPPSQPGEGVWVEVAGQQFATTTAWFTDLQANPGLYWAFAQIQYKPQLGYQCMGGLSF